MFQLWPKTDSVVFSRSIDFQIYQKSRNSDCFIRLHIFKFYIDLVVVKIKLLKIQVVALQGLEIDRVS